MTMRLIFVGLINLLLLSNVFADPLWTVGGAFQSPESVYYDQETKELYVSSIAGDGVKKDGVGWISKISIDGKVIAEKWVSGLNAPKGIRSYKGTLWVSDIDEVVAIDIKTATIKNKIFIKGSKLLNDVTVDDEGTIYVSDTPANSLYAIKDGTPYLFMQGTELESPNGLFYKEGKLYVGAWGLLAPDWSTKVPGRLYFIDLKTKEITFITKKPFGNIDGLEIDKDGNFLVSDWMAGKVYKIDNEGKSTIIASGEQGWADIGYVADKNLIVIPSMKENKVIAIEITR